MMSGTPKKTQLELKAEEDTHVSQAIKFLKDNKGVLAENPVIADVQFAQLEHPEKITSKSARAIYAAAQKRLLELFETEAEKHSLEVPANVQAWNVDQVRDWGYTADSCFLLRQPDSLTQRVQRVPGLCSHHGACCTQHYRISHSGYKSPMLDLVKYMKNHCSASDLEQFVFGDYGVSSIDFLRHILQPGSKLCQIGGPDYSRANELLNQYGPALVSFFTVHADFEDTRIHRHVGQPRGEKRGMHSMTLIGIRNTADNQFFLLQNWWAKKQFVEVDSEYLAKTGAMLSFVITPQMSIPSDFASDNFCYHESGLDKPERYPIERGESH